jgi:hypothetical protein
LAGRWAALAALALCVSCGATAIAHDSVTRYLRTKQAEDFARGWLQQIASNEMELAFKSTYDGARPAPPPEPGAPKPDKTPYEKFLSDPLIMKINAAGKNAKIEYDQTLEFTSMARREAIVRQRFLITPQNESAKPGNTETFEAYVTMERSHFRGRTDMRWLVMRYESAEVPVQ